jgi:hypothetical protein
MIALIAVKTTALKNKMRYNGRRQTACLDDDPSHSGVAASRQAVCVISIYGFFLLE